VVAVTSTLRRAANVAASVLVLGVVALFVVQAAPGVVGAEASYVVLSGSMEPSISPGDAVLVRATDPVTVAAGDVITFHRGDATTPVTHRVVDVVDGGDGPAFRTQGDANEDPDPALVRPDQLVGEVWVTMPLVGHLVLFANSTLGRLLLVAVPLAALAVSELYDYATGDDESADGRDRDPPADGFVAAVPEDAPPAGATDGSDGLSVSTTDLRLSGVGFAAFAAYSGYVAYGDPTPVSVAVFAAAAAVLALVAAVYAFGRPAPAPSAARADGGDDDAS
jgi:signal peptidase